MFIRRLDNSVLCCASQSCLTLCDPRDCSPPVSSVHGVSQARIPEWVAISFSRESAWPRDQTHISCIGRQILYHWATRGIWFSYITANTYIYSLSNFFPISVMKEYWAEFPVLCRRSLLAVYLKYSSMYLSIPNSLTILSSHSSPEQP